MFERLELSGDYPPSRFFFNILGASLTLLSVQLPWMVYGVYPVSVQSSGLYAVAFYWLLAGAILSFLSRFGGVVTFVGIIAFAGQPYASFGFARPGLGVFLALVGAILTLAGVRWSIPSGLVKGREIMGGVLYSVGFLIILTIVVRSIVYGGLFSAGSSQLVVSAPLLLVGAVMTGLGLKLFLSPERRESVLNPLTSPA